MQLGGRQRRDEVLIGCSESDVRGLALKCTYQVFDLLLQLPFCLNSYEYFQQVDTFHLMVFVCVNHSKQFVQGTHSQGITKRKQQRS